MNGHLVFCISVTAVVVSHGVLSRSLLEDRSVSCSSSSMDVSLTFVEQFSGGVFTEKGIGNEHCRWRAQGLKTMTIRIPLENSSDCGLDTNEARGEYSIKLIISPVDGLLVDGFTAISVRCIYSTQEIMLTLPPGPSGSPALHVNGPQHDDGVVTGNGVAPLLSMHILDGHGINGSPVVKASVGQRLTLDLVLKDTAIYDFHVHSCYAHDGTNAPDASINIIDSNGCAVRLSRAIDVPVFVTEPSNHGAKHIYLHMYGFQFTSSQFVHFECRVTPCVHSCKRPQCDTGTGKTLLIPALRRRREEAERSDSLKALRMKAVLQIEPQQIQKAALVSSQRIVNYCVTVDEMLFVSLLILGVVSSLVVLLYCICLPRKRQTSQEGSMLNMLHVFQ